jgi:hypothetical protein
MTALAAIVFGTFSIFIAHPLLALLPAAGFAALWAASGRWVVANENSLASVGSTRSSG